jgi:predicted permease
MTSVKIDRDANKQVHVQANAVGARYFRTAGVRVLAGRDFAESDNASAPAVAIVNQAFVKQHLRTQNAIGRVLSMAKSGLEEEAFEIVGVVADSKHISLGEDPTPVLYRPWKQESLPLPPGIQVRTSGPAAAMVSTVRDAIRDLAPSALVDVKTMRENMDLSTYPNRLGAALLGGMGMLGLVLASVGLYGVLAYAVSRRVREIGVRMALGATRAQVLRAVLGDAMALVGIGVGIGLALSLVATRPLSSFLASGITVADPITLATVVCALAVTGGIAALVPARRTLRVDPLMALRQE